LKGRAESFGEYLKRNVRIAAFLDLGNIYETTFSESGMRAGPGLGLRIIRFPVVIKLDWAYGLGRGISGAGHGRFYFSLTSNLPF
jgi:outer membrane translocation and assembly module TamA